MYFPTAKCALLPGTAFPAAAQEQVVGSSTEHRCPSLLLVQSSGPGQVVWHWGGGGQCAARGPILGPPSGEWLLPSSQQSGHDQKSRKETKHQKLAAHSFVLEQVPLL